MVFFDLTGTVKRTIDEVKGTILQQKEHSEISKIKK